MRNIYTEGLRGGAALRSKDASDRRRVERVRPQSIHRFGREGHQPAHAKVFRGPSEGLGVWAPRVDDDDLGIHNILVSVSQDPETYGTLTALPDGERFSHGRSSREFDRDTDPNGGSAAHRAGELQQGP